MFKEIKLTDVKENFVDLIKNQWALVTAGDSDSLNTMTVSWGAVGELWNQDMVTVYIRESRYTKEFVDKKDYFSFCVLPPELKSVHSVCGSKSGRDVDKVKECNLTPAFENGVPYFEEAKLVIFCRKAAVSEFTPEQFVEKKYMEMNYGDGDFHSIYYGVAEKVLVKE